MEITTKIKCDNLRCPNNEDRHCYNPDEIHINEYGKCRKALEINEMDNYGMDSCGELLI